MRLVPYDELTLLSPEVPEPSKYIHVDTATQTVTAFEGETAVLARAAPAAARAPRPRWVNS